MATEDAGDKTSLTAASNPSSLSAAPADLALLAWLGPDSSEDDDTDPPGAEATDELAPMLIE